MVKEKNVLPGDFIATEEEFEPGRNTFEAEGEIRSDSIGTVLENNVRKTVSVQKTKDVVPAKRGDIVYGRIAFMKEKSVRIDIVPSPQDGKRLVLPFYSASLPVRMVSRDYVEKLSDFFRVGDIVKAKIAAIHPDGVDVKTDESDLGVIKGFCVKCRKPLHRAGENLKCLACGSTEDRKISEDYSLN